LTAAGVDEALAASLVDEVSRHLLPFHPGQPLRDLVRDRIAASVPVLAGWPATEIPHVALFVGPSGGGKTSTVLKLAEAYHEAGLAVAVVSITLPPSQGGRTGLGSRLAERIEGGADYDVREVGTVAAARAARRALADHDLVLIDTPGAAARDAAALAHVQRLAALLGPQATHVVLPLTLADREADAAVQRFAAAGADRLAVTKLDEASFAGSLINLGRRAGLPLSVLGTGPGLRGGAEIPNGRLISERILPMTSS
jgi:flagellar biosynthesis protein FlhF